MEYPFGPLLERSREGMSSGIHHLRVSDVLRRGIGSMLTHGI